jgi:hypothetical protein
MADQREAGLAQGAIDTAIKNAVNVIARVHLPLAEVMSIVELPAKYRKKVVAKLQEQGIEYTP